MARSNVDFVKGEIRESISSKQRILDDPKLLEQITQVGHLLIDAYERGNKILIAGNGGSAADAQHIAAEFVNQFNFDRPALPALALTTDTSILTAIGNDYGYEQLFRRQIEANGVPGDVFLGISTSGNSPNILQALTAATSKTITTIGLTGSSGGQMRGNCDHCICVPSADTPRIQEAHVLIGHTLCAMVELALFGAET